MDDHMEDCRHYLRLSGCTWAIDFHQQRKWCMDLCSLSLLNHTSCHLLQHCIFCLTTLGISKKKASDPNRNTGTPNNNSTKRLNDINQTWCQCHLQLLPSHQCQRMQEHIIHQWHKEAGGALSICWLFVSGEGMQWNSNGIGLDFWYLTKA